MKIGTALFKGGNTTGKTSAENEGAYINVTEINTIPKFLLPLTTSKIAHPTATSRNKFKAKRTKNSRYRVNRDAARYMSTKKSKNSQCSGKTKSNIGKKYAKAQTYSPFRRKKNKKSNPRSTDKRKEDKRKKSPAAIVSCKTTRDKRS